MASETVQAFNTVTVRPRVDGELTQVLFREGEDVKTGDLLAVVDPRPYQAAMAQAVAKKAQDEAQLGNAQVVLKRNTELLARKVLDQQTFDTSNSRSIISGNGRIRRRSTTPRHNSITPRSSRRLMGASGFASSTLAMSYTRLTPVASLSSLSFSRSRLCSRCPNKSASDSESGWRPWRLAGLGFGSREHDCARSRLVNGCG